MIPPKLPPENGDNRFRIESDTMGEVRIPGSAYYGAQTQRAVEHFPISGQPIPVELIHALGLVKWAAANANRELGRVRDKNRQPLDDQIINAMITAADEVARGLFDGEFPVDIYQTGSGTSSNMNANEVIARRAGELLGFGFEESSPIHPNDHVNAGQSTNDIFPTAIHVAAAEAIVNYLLPALEIMEKTLRDRAQQWSDILKIGRTHLADATPLTLGQEIGGMARQIELAINRLRRGLDQIKELPVGGTAVGTGINTHPAFANRVCDYLSKRTGIEFVEAKDHFEANSQRDGIVAVHGEVKSVAVTLFNIANNIRLLASGPRCSFYEIILPDLQPGSSIMPGKVNPVLCESMIQVAARVIGNDQTITFAGATGGQFQLNIMMPVMAETLLESIRILSNATALFEENCLRGMVANRQRCLLSVEQSLSMVTGLNHYIGYEKAAALAKEAFATNKTIRELCLEKKILSPEELEEALDPWKMTAPK